ncbi:DsbA family protein [Xinfangfangia sp. CPCC 101601]|uniref:DsbA family protein n=1 Tax=Pseudogemmobacter lacusdianii TaxID=3069608 RepID=A0ABU0W1R6_9RHOB|nr:DsbA family protein [Xinfangfangia sp. CPCC 101601]MDQ2067954.1 DsbA family protein [Xinfangfangia sp. CPCC 101601]
MLTRRNLLLTASAAGLVAATPVLANDNEMPAELREAIERQPFSPVLGNPKGDVTLTEFFDYNCPICREVPPLLQKLIAGDKNLRIVLREWPVLRPSSEELARVSLASLKQKKYWQMHHGLLSAKRGLNIDAALRIAGDLGLDTAQLKRDMNSDDVSGHIWQSMDLGDHMGLSGTPTFIAGNDGRFGRQSLAELQQLIAIARG